LVTGFREMVPSDPLWRPSIYFQVLNRAIALASACCTEISGTAPRAGKEVLMLALAAVEMCAESGKTLNQEVESGSISVREDLIAIRIGEEAENVIGRSVFVFLFGHGAVTA
jgi:hypothetical protein